MKSANGFSLLEAMIAISIIMMIALTTSSFLPNQKKIITGSENQIQLQEVEQIIMNLIVPAIHHAGYLGCTSLYTTPINNHSPLLGLSQNSPLPSSLKNKVAKQSDILWVDYSSVPQHQVSTEKGATKITLTKDLALQAEQDMVITDCVSSDIHKIKSKQTNLIYTYTAISKKYEDAYLASFSSAYFYMGDTGRKTNAGERIYALYKQPVNGARQELMEGLTELKFYFATKPQSDNDYHAIEKIKNWWQITHVKIMAKVEDDIFATEAVIKNAL